MPAASVSCLARAAREAADYTGLEAEVELPDAAAGGQVLLACAAADVDRLGSQGLQRIGVVL